VGKARVSRRSARAARVTIRAHAGSTRTGPVYALSAVKASKNVFAAGAHCFGDRGKSAATQKVTRRVVHERAGVDWG
jgi:hypothetical protein